MAQFIADPCIGKKTGFNTFQTAGASSTSDMSNEEFPTVAVAVTPNISLEPSTKRSKLVEDP